MLIISQVRMLKLKILILSILSIVSSAAYSASVTQGTRINKVLVAQSDVGANVVCAYISDPINEKAECNTLGRLCHTIETDIGKALLSAALTAKSTSSTVNIAYRNSCTFKSNAQDLQFIFIVD